MYTCPRCHTELVQTREPDGVAYVCQSCGGKAIGFPLLRREITPAAARQIWGGQFGPNATEGCPCPICGSTMKQVTVMEPKGEVTLDVCTPCSFVWLDKGEAELLPEAPHVSGEIDYSKLPEEVREKLAMTEVAALREKAQAENPEPDSEWKTLPALLGLPVEMDSEMVNRTPWATYIVSVVIAGVSIAAFFRLKEIVDAYGLIPAEAGRLFGFTWISSFFVHADIWHLFGNLYFLVLFGRAAEGHLGPVRWLVVLFTAALAGSALHVVGNLSSVTPSIGASGGISGIIAFYACEFPKARLGLMLRYFFVFRWIVFPAWMALLFWVGLQCLLVWEEYAGISNVAALAHLGGGATGFVFWLLWRDRAPGSGAPSVPPAGGLSVKIQ
jgi:membrane associated rhomboid family serine protease/Zn-finger nucleic acid-binding protein